MATLTCVLNIMLGDFRGGGETNREGGRERIGGGMGERKKMSDGGEEVELRAKQNPWRTSEGGAQWEEKEREIRGGGFENEQDQVEKKTT